MIAKAANASVSTTEYRASLEEFINDENTANAVDKLKQCFLNQSVETLSNFNVMMVISAFSDVLLEPRDRDKQVLSLSLIMPKQVMNVPYFSLFHCVVSPMTLTSKPAVLKSLVNDINEKDKRGKRLLRQRDTYPSAPLYTQKRARVRTHTHTHMHTHFLSR